MILLRRLPGIMYHRRYAALSTIIIIIILLYYLVHWGIMCTNLETWQHVNKLCQLHREGKAVGNLCKPLCTDKRIQSLTCHAFHAGKEAVFSASWEGTRLVFKASRKARGSPVDPVFWVDSGGVKHYPSENDFYSMIRDIVGSKLNLSVSNDQLKRLSQLGFSKAKVGTLLRKTEMENLWVLLNDNEYLCSVLYADRDVFPQLLGTCGEFFAVEYVEPVYNAANLLTISEGQIDWPSRIRLAIMIMDFLEELDTNLPEPFHLCDIKMSHFGLAKGTQRLKFLDLDSVLPRTIVSRATADGSHCTKHEDCDFFDCHSLCNYGKNKCDHPVINNNFQVVCEKIFLGWTLSGTVIVPGLLMSQHTPTSLASLLRLCAHPNMNDDSPRTVVSEEIRKRLYSTLSEMDQLLNNEIT